MISDEKFNAFDGYLRGIVEVAQQIEFIANSSCYLTELKSINWEYLVIKEEYCNDRSIGYEVFLPINEIDRLENTEFKIQTQRGGVLTMEGRETRHFKWEESICSISVNKFLHNRIDFNGEDDNGLPKDLRGLGLGKKIYRAIIEKQGYITSEKKGTSETGKLLWESIRRNDLFYVFLTKNRAYAFGSTCSVNDVNDVFVSLSKKGMAFSKSDFLWDEDFFLKHNTEISNSDMLLKSLL